MESYSDQLKDRWPVKVEDSQSGSVLIKEEPADEIYYDAPLILPMNEVCIYFPPLASFYNFAFIIVHSLVFPLKNLSPLLESISNIRIIKNIFQLSLLFYTIVNLSPNDLHTYRKI